MATERPIAVCYNGACPLCRREIDLYRRMATTHGVTVDWRDIAAEPAMLAAQGLHADDLARRLHVVDGDGRVVAGVDAFRALWSRLPATRWLARVVGWWPVRPLAGVVYERLVAPGLYARHRRRERRRRRMLALKPLAHAAFSPSVKFDSIAPGIRFSAPGTLRNSASV